jgi:hypothetical protein
VLVLSLIIAPFVIPASHIGPPTGKTVVVYGMVVQDIFTAPTRTGRFWSIAAESELYLVFRALLVYGGDSESAC